MTFVPKTQRLELQGFRGVRLWNLFGQAVPKRNHFKASQYNPKANRRSRSLPPPPAGARAPPQRGFTCGRSITSSRSSVTITKTTVQKYERHRLVFGKHTIRHQLHRP